MAVSDPISVRIDVDTADAMRALDRLAERTIEVQQTHEALTELVVPRRQTGVIVGAHPNLTADAANEITQLLRELYPNVCIAVVSGVGSVAFEWDEDE